MYSYYAKKSLLTLLATLSLGGALTARANSPTVDQLQSQVTALLAQVAALQKGAGPVGPKQVQFRYAAGNQAAFLIPETAGDTNVIVVNGLGQIPSAPPTDAFGDPYTLVSSISDTLGDASLTFGPGYVSGPEYTAIYYCQHIKSSGNNTISFPSSQPVKLAVMEFSGTQGIIDGPVSPSGEFIPKNPNDVMITPNTNYNFAAPGGIPGSLSVSPWQSNEGIGNYQLATPGTVAFIAFY
jgi:hypothetical protein